MAAKAVALLVALAAPAAAFRTVRRSMTMENFGFLPGESPVANTDPLILGEVNYKKFVNENKPGGDKPLITRDYPLLQRVAELKLLTKTAESGLLSSLEAKGLTLGKLEKILPVAEELGLLDLLADNEEFLINGLAPLAVEPAPTLLPLLGAALSVPAGTFKALALALVALEGFLIYSSDDVTLTVLAAIPLVGLGGVFFTLGNVLESLGKDVPVSAPAPAAPSLSLPKPPAVSLPKLPAPKVTAAKKVAPAPARLLPKAPIKVGAAPAPKKVKAAPKPKPVAKKVAPKPKPAPKKAASTGNKNLLKKK